MCFIAWLVDCLLGGSSFVFRPFHLLHCMCYVCSCVFVCVFVRVGACLCVCMRVDFIVRINFTQARIVHRCLSAGGLICRLLHETSHKTSPSTSLLLCGCGLH